MKGLSLKDIQQVLKYQKIKTYNILSSYNCDHIHTYMTSININKHIQEPDLLIVDCLGNELQYLQDVHKDNFPTNILVIRYDMRHDPYGKEISTTLAKNHRIGQPLLVIGQKMLTHLFTPKHIISKDFVIGMKHCLDDPVEPANMYLDFLTSMPEKEMKELKNHWMNGWDGKIKYENPLLSRFFEKQMLEHLPKPDRKQITMTVEDITKYNKMLDSFQKVRKNDPERLMRAHMDNPKLVKALQKYRETKKMFTIKNERP